MAQTSTTSTTYEYFVSYCWVGYGQTGFGRIKADRDWPIDGFEDVTAIEAAIEAELRDSGAEGPVSVTIIGYQLLKSVIAGRP
jgi:hypothetical protein